jgi:glycosyltransferase involved in cell wall biosynthesis
MKIVVASFTFHPDRNGVAIAAEIMVRNFTAAGHQVCVVTGMCGESMRNDNSCEFEIHRFGMVNASICDPADKEAYFCFLKNSQPDLIVFHCWGAWPLEQALKHFREIGGKKILASHGYDTHTIYWHSTFPWGLGSWLKRLPRALALPSDLRALDRLVVLSTKKDKKRLFDAWVANKLGYKNVSVIPNGIETIGWNLIPCDFRERRVLSSGIFFLCVANYFPGKNQEMAIKAFCKANIAGSTLVLIGSQLGCYGNMIRDLWSIMEPAHPQLKVRFFENLDRQDVISAVLSCDITISASKGETQPLTILESMACGKPFISTDVGCVSEFEGGIVVNNTEQMAGAMRELAGNPAERGELGRRGKECFERNYSAEVTNCAWLDLIHQVVNSGNAVQGMASVAKENTLS